MAATQPIADLLDLLKEHVIDDYKGRLECWECMAWSEVGGELHHDEGCRYVKAVKFLNAVDPQTRIQKARNR